jgi:CMP-N,N'-diacetyllegionaminic acid synthase
MINSKTVVAIVPARGGSKYLLRKNVRMLCGEPLIGWTIKKALKSAHIDTLVVSTDDEEISQISLEYKAEIIKRPSALATDIASTYDVIRHALEAMRKDGGRWFDYVVLLEPTSPLREDDDIDTMLTALDSCSDFIDSIVSVGQMTENMSAVKQLVNGRVKPFDTMIPQAARRQDSAAAYFPYGVAYIAKTDVLLTENTFYTERCMPYIIKRYQCYEIDDLYDLVSTEAIMRREWGIP